MTKKLTELLQRYTEKPSVLWSRIVKNSVNSKKRIVALEAILRSERGFVFKLPKPGEPVIAFMSGGLDTTVVIGLLLELGLSVYPLVVDRGLRHSQKTAQSIKNLTQYFSLHYPDLFHQPHAISAQFPPKAWIEKLSQHENDLLRSPSRRGIALQPAAYAHLAVWYAEYLEHTQQIKPRTIVGGWLPSNSLWYRYESFESLRSVMAHICIMQHDFSWQFTSLPMEKELGFYFDKEGLVKLGATLGIPLAETWTCFDGKTYQCGVCPPCWTRKHAFKKARVVDPTIYRFEDWKDWRQKLARWQLRLKQALHLG
jgi:7-cyano-7-deazaguanine synthase in queuosine biosynthesis